MNLSELPNPQRRAIEIVKEVARDKGLRPYLVGGPVRDLLLGRSSVDLDLTLEDDSSTLARALARRLSGRVKSFPQFLTYKVVAEGLPEIDIATCRKEKYRTPGALPTVSPGKLKDDLLRRDFGMNALAFDLLDGTLRDPAGGEGDIRSRVVRILHPESFFEDPTRALRAVRLAERLGFELEAETEKRLHDAIAGGAMRSISRERVWRELFLAMDEECAPAILGRMTAYGMLESLFGRREAHRPELEIVQKQLASMPELDRYVLYTGALLHGDATPLELEGSGFSQKRARNVMQIANELARFGDALTEAKSERQRLRVLRHASPEVRSLIAATRPDRSAQVARYDEFEKFRLPLRALDLEMEQAGPHISRALERTREAVFTGEIAPEEARNFARQMAIRYLGRETQTGSK